MARYVIRLWLTYRAITSTRKVKYFPSKKLCFSYELALSYPDTKQLGSEDLNLYYLSRKVDRTFRIVAVVGKFRAI